MYRIQEYPEEFAGAIEALVNEIERLHCEINHCKCTEDYMPHCPVCKGNHPGSSCPVQCITCGCALDSWYFYQKSKGPFCCSCAKEHGRTINQQTVDWLELRGFEQEKDQDQDGNGNGNGDRSNSHVFIQRR